MKTDLTAPPIRRYKGKNLGLEKYIKELDIEIEVIGRFYKMPWPYKHSTHRKWVCNDCGEPVDSPHRPDCLCGLPHMP